MTRGDVFRIRAPRDARGHEQRGARYAIVVQATELELSTVLVAPTSRRALATSFRPEVVVGGTRTRALADQVRAVDRGRLGRPVGRLSPDEMNGVDGALATVLGLDP